MVLKQDYKFNQERTLHATYCLYCIKRNCDSIVYPQNSTVHCAVPVYYPLYKCILASDNLERSGLVCMYLAVLPITHVVLFYRLNIDVLSTMAVHSQVIYLKFGLIFLCRYPVPGG